MKDTRNRVIDLLRGLAIIIMVVLHTTPHFLKDPAVWNVWNYGHFVVPIFVFCSSYIVFTKKPPVLSLSLFSKRLMRLLIPYYIFAVVLILYAWLIKASPLSMNTVVNRIFFLDGYSADTEWLVVLFVYVMLLNIAIVHIAHKSRLMIVLFSLSVLSSALLLVYGHIFPYRHIMWLPWSSVIFFAFYMFKYERHAYFIPFVFALSLSVCLIGVLFLETTGRSLVLVHNKYPPNLFYLSYGISILILLHQIFTHIPLPQPIVSFLKYLSVHSYTFFFIHFMVIYIALDFTGLKSFGVSIFTIVVFLFSLMVQELLNRMKKYIPL